MVLCIRVSDIIAVGSHADTVGAAGVTIPVTRLNSPIQEVGGTAGSALVWDGVIGLSSWDRVIGLSSTLSP